MQYPRKIEDLYLRIRDRIEGHLIRRASRSVIAGELILALYLAASEDMPDRAGRRWSSVQRRLQNSQSPMLPTWYPTTLEHPTLWLLLLAECLVLKVLQQLAHRDPLTHSVEGLYPLGMYTPVANAHEALIADFSWAVTRQDDSGSLRIRTDVPLTDFCRIRIKDIR